MRQDVSSFVEVYAKNKYCRLVFLGEQSGTRPSTLR